MRELQDLAASGRAFLRGLGRGVAHGMPILLRLPAILGTASMIWVGGGILMHGLVTYGLSAPAHAAHEAAFSAASYVPFAKGSVAWPVTAMAPARSD
ncbi:hypothetical protein AO398_15030 [Methylobacterium sp. GXS13]|jgi:predicted DNA repair protein MutK|nr:hypothetical protein AO398_15030 [Methylobacterium sp. GXS13]